MDPNITIKPEPCYPCKEGNDISFETSASDFSEIDKMEVMDYEEFKPHVANIKMEDDPVPLSLKIIKRGKIEQTYTEHKKSFSCPISICKIAFSDISTFIGHLNAVHTLERMNFCPICNYNFNSYTSNAAHITLHMWEHNTEEYQACPQMKVTQTQIKNLKRLKSDGKTTAQKPTMFVGNCRKTAPKTSMVEREYFCPVCRKSFTVLADLVNHIDVHSHKQGKYSYCSVCKLQFKTDNGLLKHMQTHEVENINSKNDREFKDTMNISYKIKNAIGKSHSVSVIHSSSSGRKKCISRKQSTVVSKDKFIYCPVCNISFNSVDKIAMIAHFERSHNCSFCGTFWGWAWKSDMNAHIKSHFCQACQLGKSVHQLKSFLNKYKQECNCCIACGSENIEYNNNDNNESLVCACNLCYQNFTKPQNLVSHMLDHADCNYQYKVINENGSKEIIKEFIDKSYCCMLCQISFNTYIGFLEHMNEIHSFCKEMAKYACSICCKNHNSQSYNVFPDLISHLKVHKQYFCSVCNLQFKTDNELTKHMQTHEIEKGKPEKIDNPGIQ